MVTPLPRTVFATVMTSRPPLAPNASPPPPGGRALALRDGVFSFLLELLVREADLSVPVDLENPDHDLVALLVDVGNGPDPVFADLGNVEEPVGSGEEFHEGAELHDPPPPPRVDFAFFRLLHDPLDDGDGRPRGLPVHRGDFHGPRVPT